jgi:pimeloyl-ACP methyl ester carboxylesterase
MARMFEHKVRMADGLWVYVRDWRPDGRATGAPVFCAHGLTRNSLDFEDVAPAIVARGRRVVALDVRGRGLSDNDPKPMNYTPVTYAADSFAVWDALGIDRAVWIGTSMGGLMAMIAAVIAPERLVGVVLNDIGPEIAPEGLRRIAGYVGGAAPVDDWPKAARYCREINGTAFPDAGDDFWTAFARRIFCTRTDGLLELAYDPAIAEPMRAGAVSAADPWLAFERLEQTPTLVVRGALSDILSSEGLSKMCARHPDIEAVEVPRIGHAPLLTEPAAAAAIERFLARLD